MATKPDTTAKPLTKQATAPRRQFHIDVPDGFDFRAAVCSYGYFLLAPNRWWPLDQALDRPILTDAGRVIKTRVTQPALQAMPSSTVRSGSRGKSGAPLLVTCDLVPTKAEIALISRQLSRMLRLDEPAENFTRFQKLCPAAKKRGFGRLFRSPTLFEDIVKTMTGCNVTWPNTMRMNRLLVEHVGAGAFPSPGQLAAMDEAELKTRCKVGYRAGRIIRLAKEVCDGTRDLTRLQDPLLSTEEVFESLKTIHGVGAYAASNICQLVGRYDRLAIDSETYRHFRQHHKIPTPDNPAKLNGTIEKHYSRFAPFEFLAYWFELWRCYEERVGDAWMWDCETHGGTFTASQLNKREK